RYAGRYAAADVRAVHDRVPRPRLPPVHPAAPARAVRLRGVADRHQHARARASQAVARACAPALMCQGGFVTIVPPSPGEPRRPHGPRDPGDAWVVAPTGERYWGRFGAAGLLALDADLGVLLQHRVAWSHFGDTWGLPGGARHEG